VAHTATAKGSGFINENQVNVFGLKEETKFWIAYLRMYQVTLLE